MTQRGFALGAPADRRPGPQLLARLKGLGRLSPVTWIRNVKHQVELHVHDLRHTANGFASNVASLKELMARMGHSTTRAALIYQHAQLDREREIAAAVSAAVEAQLTERERRS